jgi:hypothetical protein
MGHQRRASEMLAKTIVQILSEPTPLAFGYFSYFFLKLLAAADLEL